jgi:hypothetical protein
MHEAPTEQLLMSGIHKKSKAPHHNAGTGYTTLNPLQLVATLDAMTRLQEKKTRSHRKLGL